MADNPRDHVLTADEFARLPNNKDWELVDGVLVERRKGNRAAWLAGRLTGELGNHVRDRRLGWVFGPGAGFVMDPQRPNTVRRPSGSSVSFERLEHDEPSSTFDWVTPDLAIEVLGMADSISDMIERGREFLSNGMRTVWLIEPQVNCIRILSRTEGSVRLGIDDRLNGGDVVPEFTCRLNDIFAFPNREGAEPNHAS